MTDDLMESLPLQRQADVLAALAAVESAHFPVPAKDFRALLEPPLRHVLEQLLHRAGRVLIKVGPGYVSGYDDQVAAELADLGIGILTPEQRAVLTMVLLFTVAIPRAEGHLRGDDMWTSEHPVSPQLLETGTLQATVVRTALRDLGYAGLIRRVANGIVPGPQFLRLTSRATSVLFEELVLLAEPQGDLALSIRRERGRPAPSHEEHPA
ncbi:hypothetical protein [Kutzneria chonburiensis]|uniref:Uncharacterized protein n=1 Tax=Kutzneria chonburiensis TaxID=1483604 RepID=A0ABV6MPS0_9PSEU|nr:hypothetical protein [Kutzneria chonburiensis]